MAPHRPFNHELRLGAGRRRGSIVPCAVAGGLLWLSMGGAVVPAAPVTRRHSSEQAEVQTGSAEASAVDAAPNVSTGNRHLDLLLGAQGRGAGESATAASRPASGAMRVPLPNTNLSGGVMNEARAKPVAAARSTDGSLIGEVGDALRVKPQARDPLERREWVGQPQGSGSSGGGGEERPRVRHVDEPPLYGLVREWVDLLRDHRWEVLGIVFALAGLAGLIKAYSRRA